MNEGHDNIPTRSDVVRKAIEAYLAGRGKNPPAPESWSQILL
jgi:hypothetical protein